MLSTHEESRNHSIESVQNVYKIYILSVTLMLSNTIMCIEPTCVHKLMNIVDLIGKRADCR
jgi:hypothetical protein